MEWFNKKLLQKLVWKSIQYRQILLTAFYYYLEFNVTINGSNPTKEKLKLPLDKIKLAVDCDPFHNNYSYEWYKLSGSYENGNWTRLSCTENILERSNLSDVVHYFKVIVTYGEVKEEAEAVVDVTCGKLYVLIISTLDNFIYRLCNKENYNFLFV